MYFREIKNQKLQGEIGSDFMSIRFNAYNNYNNVSNQKTVVNKSSGRVKTGVPSFLSDTKQDTVSISTNSDGYSIAKTYTAVTSDVNSYSGNDRVSAIKSKIANGEYSVSSQDIAGSILDRFV